MTTNANYQCDNCGRRFGNLGPQGHESGEHLRLYGDTPIQTQRLDICQRCWPAIFDMVAKHIASTKGWELP